MFRRDEGGGHARRARRCTDSFARWPNLKIVLLALFGATAGQAVVWYGGQFYSLFFLTQTLKVDAQTANLLVAGALLLATPFFVVFGWLSDRIGRKPIVLGRLPARCADVLPAVRRADAFRESGDRARRGRRIRSPSSPIRADCQLPVRSDRQGALHQLVRHRQERAGEGRRAVRERGGAVGSVAVVRIGDASRCRRSTAARSRLRNSRSAAMRSASN